MAAEVICELLLVAAPMVAPMCDAQMVAQFVPMLTKAEYLQVVDVADQIGVGAEYAAKLRALIEEAYATEDLAAWARAKCAEEEV